MRATTALLLATGFLASFGAGLWFGQRPTTLDSQPITASHESRVSTQPTKPEQNRRGQIAVPTTARDWRRLLDEINPEDVPQLLETALAIRDTNQRASVLQRLLEVWALEAPADAFSWLSHQQHLPQLYLSPIFEAWAEHDPAAAINSLASITDHRTRQQAAIGLCEAWTRHDPTAAMAWARQLPASEVRNSALNSICSVLAETDPQQAVAYALSLGEDGAAASRLSGIIRIQATTDPQAALLTINNLPAGVPRGPLCKQIVDALVAEDPKLAGAFALTIPPSRAQHDALQTVAWRLAHDSLPTTLNWINTTIPSGPIRGTVLQNTLIGAAQTDPRAVAPIVATLRGNLRLNVALNVALNWVRSDPQAACAWASQLPADHDRASVQQTLFNIWSRNDPAAATAWLATTDLPEATKQKLLTPTP